MKDSSWLNETLGSQEGVAGNDLDRWRSPSEILQKKLTSLMPERSQRNHPTSVRSYLATSEKHVGWGVPKLSGRQKIVRELPIEISDAEDLRNGKHFLTGTVRDAPDRKRSQEALQAR